MGSLLTGILSPISLPNGQTTRLSTTSSSSVSSRSSSSSYPVSTSSSSSLSSSIVSSSTSPITSTSSTTSSTSSTESSWSPSTVTTVVVDSTSYPPPATDSDTGSNTSFLQNKVASGFVFAIVGLVGFVIIIFIATFFLKRRNNQRLMRDAVSFDPVTIGHNDLEKANQSSSLGHGSHDAKSLSTDNHYSPPSSHHHGGQDNHFSPPSSHYHGNSPIYNPHSPPPSHQYGNPPPNFTPHMAAQLYAPPVRYSSPPLPPLPMQQQPSHLQRHLSYMSAMSSAEEARPMSGEMRGATIGGQIPDGIRRQYNTP